MPKRPGTGKSKSKIGTKVGTGLSLTESESQATTSAAAAAAGGGGGGGGQTHRVNHSTSRMGVNVNPLAPSTPGRGHGRSVGGIVGPSERPQMLVVSCRFGASLLSSFSLHN